MPFLLPVFRWGAVPRRLQRSIEPIVRGRGEALVHVYAGASAGIAGILPCLQELSGIERARWSSNPSKLVAFSPLTDAAGRAQREKSHLESRSGCVPCWYNFRVR